MPNSSRCAACKSLRRRCSEDCVLAPYFPATHPERFTSVHKIFGASNVSKMLQRLPVYRRSEAAESMIFEAHSRIQDPVYGCVGIITRLQQHIKMKQHELAVTRAQLAFRSAVQHDQTRFQLGEPSHSIHYQTQMQEWPLQIEQLQQHPETYHSNEFHES